MTTHSSDRRCLQQLGSAVDLRPERPRRRELSSFARASILIAGAAMALLATAAAAAFGAWAQDNESSPRRDESVGDLTLIAKEACAAHKLPAVALAIVTPDGVDAFGCAGVRAKGDEAVIEPSDQFHLGSCTKAMTATLAALLVKDGSLRWETTVGEVLGPSMPSMDESWRAVTVEELLRHSGGAPGPPPFGAWARAFGCTDPSRECRRAFVESIVSTPVAQPRGTVVYSNQGYAIVGAMMEQITGTEYEALITERLFKPLGITSAGFGPPPDAKGHRENGTAVVIDNPAAISPAGRAHMTLQDWAKFIALHLRRDGGTALPLVRADFDHLHSLVGAGEAPKEGMALGWIVAQRGWGGRVLTHAGSNTVWFCVAWLAPDRGFAMIAATNQGGAAGTQACDEAIAKAMAWRAARAVSRGNDAPQEPHRVPRADP